MKKLCTFLFLTLFCLPAQGQTNDSLIVLFLSAPGVRPAQIFTDGFESGDLSLLDYDGDGKAEVILERENSQGGLRDLLAVNTASLDTLWRFESVQATLGQTGDEPFRFAGFADADGDGVREGIFVNDVEVAIVDPRDPQVDNWRSNFNIGFPPALRLLGIVDMNDDGLKDIVVALPEDRQVAIFSKNPATTPRK